MLILIGRPPQPGHGQGQGPHPPVHNIPYIFFHDADDYDDYVDMGDIFDNDMETGETMIALPSNWTHLTLQNVNEGKFRRNNYL